MQRVSILAFLAALVVVLVPQLARAGCPATCDFSATTVVVEPALPCLQVTSGDDSCGCELPLQFRNECAAPVEAKGFTFDSCGPELTPSSDFANACPSIEAMGNARLESAFQGDGKQQIVREVVVDGTAHRVTFSTTVSNYDGSPGGCAFTPRPNNQTSLAAVVGVVLALFSRRSRAPRR